MSGETTLFHDLHDYVGIPRLDHLVLSPDGSRLVVAVATLNPKANGYVSALWEIDPAGEKEAQRLTRSADGESTPAFLPDGSVLFTSKRPDPDAKDPKPGDDEAVPALWLLPVAGGEAYPVATRPGGFTGLVVAHDSGTVLATSPTFPGSLDADEDEARRTARRDAKVNAILFESTPVRFWDHDLGPDEAHLLAGPADALKDVTPEAGQALAFTDVTVSPDGSTAVAGWIRPMPEANHRVELVAIDTTTRERRTIGGGADFFYAAPAVAPDGRSVVALREGRGTWDAPGATELWVGDLTGGEGRTITGDFWPVSAVFTPDSRALLVCGDQRGHRPVFRVDLDSGEATRLTAEGSYSSLQPSPDGSVVYALASSLAHPPRPVRFDATTADQTPRPLPAPGGVDVPGRLEEVAATAEDGTPLRAWLVLPADQHAPAPLVVWMHGGPVSSWNDWSWRWNPHLMAARGWAVLLPDPAFSTGYGYDFVARGHGQWGGAPFTDVMALTDAALRRPDLDPDRTAAMGGSYGGYLANWTAGHTDRFRAIVTHASLWALDHFQATTDLPSYWETEFDRPERRRERYDAWSPHLFADNISTPMLVIHGDRDYRVPIGEALHLWTDLCRRDVEAKFLYFPNENHWVLQPNDAVVWYETVLAFLGHHVLGEKWERPKLL